MNGLSYVMFHRSQRVLKGLLLGIMVWFLGMVGITHTHDGAPHRSAAPMIQSMAQEERATLTAPSEDEDCAICLWKVRNPYVPAASAPATLPLPLMAAHDSAAPRAPPSYSLERLRTRAPPTLLS